MVTAITRRVLLVDDCQSDRDTYHNYLLCDKQHNYSILEASTGKQALLLCQQQFPDAIVTDYLLPDMNALEFLENLKTQFGLNFPPVIILTSRGNEQIAVRAMKGGAADYLVKKNTTTESLREAIESVLEKTYENAEAESRVQDITYCQQAEETLRSCAAEFEELYNNSPCGYHSLDKDGIIIRINYTELQMLGYNQEEVLGRKFSDLITPESRPIFQNNFLRFQELSWVKDLEFEMVRKDGTILPISLSATAIKDSAGNFLFSRSVVMDISERQAARLAREQAQEDLKQSERKFRAIFDSTFEFMGLLNLEGIVIEINQTALDVIAVERSDVIGQPFWKTPWWTHFPEQHLQLRQAIASAVNGEFIRFETKHIWADGTLAFVDFSLKPIFDEKGNVVMLVPEGRDITEKKHLENQFHRAQRLESLGTLASGISHDLNNILTPILGVAQLLPLKLPNLDEQDIELLKILEDNSKRGAELVKQITVFARGAEGKRVSLQLRHLLKEIEGIVRSSFPKSIEICVNIPNKNLWTISADPTQIHQVVMNLCINARDAMADGGTLTLTAENQFIDENYAKMNLEAKVGNYVVITVSDTGCGIAQEIKERIFEPFFTTKEVGKGTGLGLSTVIGIIKNHGGFVNVCSSVGKGSQFKVYFSASQTEEILTVDKLQIASGNGELILIVDDEASVRDITKTSLLNYNYRVLTACDAIDAFSLYAQHNKQISLVLMDIQMPSIDGLNAIRVLQQMNPKVKIIAISGGASSRQLLTINNVKVEAFLAKPYTIHELMTCIKTVLIS